MLPVSVTPVVRTTKLEGNNPATGSLTTPSTLSYGSSSKNSSLSSIFADVTTAELFTSPARPSLRARVAFGLITSGGGGGGGGGRGGGGDGGGGAQADNTSVPGCQRTYTTCDSTFPLSCGSSTTLAGRCTSKSTNEPHTPVATLG